MKGRVGMQNTLYVAPIATGRQDGSAPEHAFGSLRTAVEAARKLQGKVIIQLLKGEHLLSQTLTLNEQDSGLSIQGQDAVIASGTPLTGWRPEGNDIVSAPIPEDACFNRLYVNGTVRERTRMPETGHFENGKLEKSNSLWLAELSPEERKVSKRLMRFRPGDIPENLYRPEDVEFVVLQYWLETRCTKIEHIDYEKGEIRFGQEGFRPYHWSFGFYLENVREGLSVPGRWYHDHKENRIYYHLQQEESLENLRVVCPTLRTLIDVLPSAGQRVNDLHFEGITFAYTDAHPAGQLHSFAQAELPAPVSLLISDAENCSFDRCSFTQLGGYALWLRGNSRHCRVDHCSFTFCAAGAVRIGETRGPNTVLGDDNLDHVQFPKEAPADGRLSKTEYVSITNNIIADCGWYYHGSAGIWIGQGANCTVAHNDISGPLQWAISVGWSWYYLPMPYTFGNRIEKNFIHELGTGILGTHAAIYLLAVSPCTIVDSNYIRNVYSTPYWGAGEGIIMDNGCAGGTVQNNIVLNASAGGWGCNFNCLGNIIRNNIFCFGKTFQLTRYGDPPDTPNPPPNGEFFCHNIIIWKEGPLFGEKNWLSFNTVWDYNLYWYTEGQPSFMGRTFDEWKALGMDVHSLNEDPRLGNPENEDFTLPEDSPAFKIGFEPFSIDDVGVQP